MPFNIKEFISHSSKYGDYAKTDKFDVRISIPKSLLTSNFGIRELAFQCEAAELPGRNINMIEYRHHGFAERVAHFNTFSDLNLTFYCNNQFREKKFFDSWIDSMIPTYSGLIKYYHNDSYENQYSTEITIIQYDHTGNPIYRCKVIEAIPILISPMALSWQDDSVHRLQVTFQYKFWRTEELSDPRISEVELTERQQQRRADPRLSGVQLTERQRTRI